MYSIMGATGNVGGKVTGTLLDRGEKVRVIARSADKLRRFAGRGAEIAAGDAMDTKFLTEAFRGADAVFAIIPPNVTAPDFIDYANRIGESIAEAISDSGVKYVVNLSSLGADLPDKNGPIRGLHLQEQRLNKLEGVNVLHLRPTYFMENLLWDIPLIKNKGIEGGPLRGDLKFRMIATKDIAKVAADYLVKRNFSGKSVKELLGPRDMSMDEATAVIGKKIGKPDLRYVQFSYDEAVKGLTAAGFSPDMARLYVEMDKGRSEGIFGTGEVRTPETSLSEGRRKRSKFFLRSPVAGVL